MRRFIEENRQTYGVGSICRVLSIAPSVYYAYRARQKKPCVRNQKDKELCHKIRRVWNDNFCVYGARKVWHQLRREGFTIARCTVERLMRSLGLQGAVRGKVKRTTFPSKENRDPFDLVKRDFTATRPNQLWVADFTYVATWVGFVFVAFIIDAFSRMIVGWRAAATMSAELTLDALEQAIWARDISGKLIHHSDHGSQYLSIRYSERLAEAGIEASVGSVGSAYDNALAETINGLYKTEVIRKRGPWKNLEAVEYATLEWVHWFNNVRLFEPIGSIPPAELEKAYYTDQHSLPVAAGLT